MASTQIDRLGSIPLAPVRLTATAVAGGFTLNWTGSADPAIGSYQVSVAPGSGQPFSEALAVSTLAAPATTTTFTPGYGAAPLTVFLQAVGTGGASAATSVGVTPLFPLTLLLGAAPGDWTNTAPRYPFLFTVGGADPTAILGRAPGLYNEDALAGAILAPVGSTQYQVNGVAGYAVSNSAATFAVGLFSAAGCGANGVYAWGCNPGVNDYGFASPLIQGVEVDCVTTNGATNCNGLSLNIAASARSSGLLNGIVVACAGGGVLSTAFQSADGAAIDAFFAGRASQSANSNSQLVVFNTADSTNTAHEAIINGFPTPGGAGLYLQGTGTGAVVECGSPFRTQQFTVATLPSASLYAGAEAWVTDAVSPAYRGALTGGGATYCKVFSTGAAWLTC
jgi:hypothetical protein